MRALFKACSFLFPVLMLLHITGAFPCAFAAREEQVAHWPIYHGDNGLRGVSGVTLPETLSVKWRHKVGSPVSMPPIVAGARVFAVTENGGLVAVDLNGHPCWSFSFPVSTNPASSRETLSTPPLWVSGTVLAGSDQGVLYAFDAATGVMRWKQRVGNDLLGSPNWVECDGTGTSRVQVLMMSRQDGTLKCFACDDGKLIWASKPVQRCDVTPSVGPGVAVFGACDSVLHIVSLTNGVTAGAVSLGDRGPMAGGTAVEGTRAYIGTRDGSVVCTDIKTSSIIWASRCASNEVFTTPAVTPDQVIVGSNDGHVYGLDRTSGKTIWSVLLGENPSSPVVAGDKAIVTAEGTLVLLDLQTGKRIWSDKAADTLSSAAVSDAGIVVGTDDGFLILYGPARGK